MKKQKGIQEMEMYQKRPGSATLSGVLYEQNMTLLLFTRAIRNEWNFRMAQNMHAAQDFDDIVINVSSLRKTFFIQLKHKSSPQSVMLSQLQNLSGDFSLFKYLRSYYLIREHYIRDLSHFGNFEDFVFVMYTNACLDGNVSTFFTPVKKKWVNFLNTEGEVYSLNIEHFEKIRELLENRETYKLLLQKAVNSTLLFSSDEEQRLLQLLQTFSNNNLKKLPNREELQKDLKRFMFLFEKAELTSACFENFLKQFVFFSKQSTESHLEIFIIKELEQIYKTKVLDKSCIGVMRKKLQQIADGKYYMTPASDFWVDVVVQPWILKLSKDMLEQLHLLLKIKFTDEEYKRICGQNTKTQVIVAKKGGMLLSILKIHQHFEAKSHILMNWKTFSENPQQVLTLLRRWCDIFVLQIEDTANLNVAIRKMNTVLMQKNKRLILIVEHKDDVNLNVETIFDDSSIWNSLSEDSKQELLNVKMVIQGTHTTFGKAVGKKIGKWQELMSSSFVLHLIKAEHPVELGSMLNHPDTYIRRPLLLFETLNSAVFQVPHAKFAISGISEVDFQRKYSVGIMLNRFFMITSIKEFNKLARKFKNIHWLHYNGSALVWKHSSGDMSAIVENIDNHIGKPKICELEEIIHKNRILLTAESGMGKSTFLSQVAAKIKCISGGSLWIARINLENHRHFFDVSAVVPKELDLIVAAENLQDNKLARDFLEMMLKAGRIVVLFDSFDEVSHYDTVLNVLRNFIKHHNITLWLATRHISGARLETLFQMLPYSLPYFTRADQERFLLYKWTKINTNIQHVKQFIKCILDSIYVHPCGVPLLLLIISEIFQEELETFIGTGMLFTVPKALDNFYLHEKYVTKKLEIYCARNGLIHKSMLPVIKDIFMENHMILSLVEVVDVNEFEIANYLKTKVASLNKERIQNMGIVNVNNMGKSSFLHRSFAEYFVALWFKHYHSMSVNYLRSMLFRREFQTIRKFLDHMLAEGFTLHSAIIKGEKGISLPNTKMMINSKDIGGRIPLHLLVLAYKDEMSLGFNCSSSVHLAEELLKRGANPNETDNILGWSCAEYAIKAEAWALLDLMLKYGVKYHCLANIKYQLQKRPHNDRLLTIIAKCGFTYLLELVLKHITIDKYVNESTDIQKTMLHIAVEAGNMEMVKKLVIAGANVNLQILELGQKKCGTALHIAAQKGNQQIVQYLLEKNASLDLNGPLGRTPIEEAAVFSKWKMVCFLSNCGAKLRGSFYSPLVCAVKRGKLSVVRHLIRNHNISAYDEENVVHLALVLGKLEILKLFDSEGLIVERSRTSLVKAASAGMLGVVKYLIQGDTAISINIYGPAALYNATVSGKHKISSFLRKSGAIFDSRESEIQAFHKAVRLGNVKTLNTLLKHVGVDKRNRAGWTALHMAAWGGLSRVITFLLQHGAYINAVTEKYYHHDMHNKCYFNKRAPNINGNTALHLAAARGKNDVLKLLIDNGADISRYNKDGETALHVAANRGHFKLLKYLCTVYKVNSARTRKGDLVVHCAVRQKNAQVLRCLIKECSAEVNAKDRNGLSPLCLAAENNSVLQVILLLNNGADINQKDNCGNTPLILAAQHGNLDVIQILLKRDAEVDSQNRKGSTALHAAAGRLDFEAVILLVTEGVINIHMRDKKGRTAFEIVEKRCENKPSCSALEHKYQNSFRPAQTASRGGFKYKQLTSSKMSPKNGERCNCIDANSAFKAQRIMNYLQHQIY